MRWNFRLDPGARLELLRRRMRNVPSLAVVLALLVGAPLVRAAVPSDAEDLGRCGDDEVTEPLLLAFPPRDAAALAALLAAQSDPRDRGYRHWISPQEFGDRFGAAAADYEAGARWLRRHGFSGIRTWPGRLAIAFEATAGQVARAFKTPLRAYRSQGAVRMAPERTPSLPAFGSATPVLLGLDGFVRMEPGVRVGTADRLGPSDVYVAHGVD